MYTLILQKQPSRFLDSINEPDYTRLRSAIDELKENYFVRGKNTKRLKGSLEKYFRIRVGNYRVVYSVHHDKRMIEVVLIKQRNSIY